MASDEVHLDGSASPTLSSDLVYSILSDARRRYAFHYLKQCQEPITVRELAEQVAAWENNKPGELLSSQEKKRVYISLYQSHLPSLHKEGIVQYEKDRGIVQLTDELIGMEIYLEVVPRGNVPWSSYYLGLTIVDALILALAYFEVTPFDRVPDLAWGAIVLITFGISAFVQTYYARRMRFGDAGPPPELQKIE